MEKLDSALKMLGIFSIVVSIWFLWLEKIIVKVIKVKYGDQSEKSERFNNWRGFIVCCFVFVLVTYAFLKTRKIEIYMIFGAVIGVAGIFKFWAEIQKIKNKNLL